MNRYHAIVIDGESASRMFWKQAFSARPEFSLVRILPIPAEAIAAVEFAEQLDAVLIADTFDEQEVATFVSRCRRTRKGRGLIYGRLTAGDANDAECGRWAPCDICLARSDPNALTELLTLLSTRGAESARSRECRNIRSLLRSIAREIDRLSLLQRAGIPGEYSVECRSSSARLREFWSFTPELVAELVVAEFCRATLPAALTKRYDGASERVRRMTGQQLDERPLVEEDPSKEEDPLKEEDPWKKG